APSCWGQLAGAEFSRFSVACVLVGRDSGSREEGPMHMKSIPAAVAALGLVLGPALAGCRVLGETASPAVTTGRADPAGVAAAVDPAVVDVVSTLGLQSEQAAGTGIVLTSTGEVLTNNHVISGATSITATDVGNGRAYRATVVGYDRTDDLAV